MLKPISRNPLTNVILWKGPLGRKSSAKHSHTSTLTWNGKKIGIDRRRMNPENIGSFGSDRKIIIKSGKIYIGQESDRTSHKYYKPKQAADIKIKNTVKRINQVIKLLEEDLEKRHRINLNRELKELKKYLKIPKEVNFADRKTR